MNKMQDSGIQYTEDHWAVQNNSGEWDQDDADYSDSDSVRQTNGVWELPGTPFNMTVDLMSIDPDLCSLIARELGIDEDSIDPFNLYVERLEGEIQYLIINDIRYESVEELPYNIRRFMDDIFFGDVENPVITSMGARVNLWDALRGEAETQQALYHAGIHDDHGQIDVVGLLSPVTSLDRMDQAPSVKMGNTIHTRVVDMQVKQYIEKSDQKRKSRRLKIIATVLIIAGIAALMVSAWLFI